MNQTQKDMTTNAFTTTLVDTIGRPVRLTVRCPKLQYHQILRMRMDSWDAVKIAEERWNKAQTLRKQRARARQRKLDESKVYETL